ncbi:MAG: Ig-like domain-containing protein [Anaerolineales bacterium]|nr:Ig-like domain-containing protein [Anaerolineales bacterium]
MNNRSSQDATVVSHHGHGRKKFPSLLGCLASLGLCVVLVVASLGGYYVVTSTGEAGILVLIHEPQNGETIEMSQPVTVQAVASDSHNITRIEFWVDGVLLESETSSVPDGISSFPLLTEWQVESPGAHTITVRAFNSLGFRAHASVYVKANEFTDSDNDGVANENDACPAEFGMDHSSGCPDRDFDGVPDSTDACPETAGLPDASGCPTVTDTDLDGDDTSDTDDLCPAEPGSSLTDGCPDSDGDLVADDDDLCPLEPGLDESGCPVPEVAASDDLPPVEESGVAPGGGANDRDGDGASDDVDPCPDEAGTFENDFCPPPADDPAPADAGPMLEIPDFLFGEAIIPAFVEFEALHFEVTSDFRRIWCYAQLAGGDVERYEFDPGEEYAWDIEAVLGGGNSIHLLVPHAEPLAVFVECYGLTSLFGPRVFYLGSVTRGHMPEEWDGHVIQAESTGEEIEGHNFNVRYHLCSPTCEATEFAPPVITRHTIDRDRIHLYWDWEGEIRSIQGFKLYLNGNFIGYYPPEVRDTTWRHSGGYCVHEWEFSLTAFGGPDPSPPDVESPRSNSVIWDSVPCQMQIRVQFETINLHSPPADEGGERKPGPLSGSFLAASGANLEAVNFDAIHCPRFPFPPFEDCFGFKLSAGEYPIQRILERVHEVQDDCRTGLPCHGHYFHASSSDTVTIFVNPGDDLTLRARIVDADPRDEDDILFQEIYPVDTTLLSPDEILTITIPGTYLDVIVNLDLFPFAP